jgi:uncharacterized protein (DUF1330 family)
MSAYILVDITITDPIGYEVYKPQAAASIAAFGGRYLARGGATEVLEGDWQPQRLVLLEFPDTPTAKAWLESDDYRGPRALRQATSTANMVLIAGTPG